MRVPSRLPDERNSAVRQSRSLDRNTLDFSKACWHPNWYVARRAFLGAPEPTTAFVVSEAHERDAVDGEYQSLHRRAYDGWIASDVDNTSLQRRRVRDLEQRVDIFQANLPQPEYLHLLRVQSRELDVGPRRAEEEMIIPVAVVGVVPRLLDDRFAHLIVVTLEAVAVFLLIVVLWLIITVLGTGALRRCC